MSEPVLPVRGNQYYDGTVSFPIISEAFNAIVDFVDTEAKEHPFVVNDVALTTFYAIGALTICGGAWLIKKYCWKKNTQEYSYQQIMSLNNRLEEEMDEVEIPLETLHVSGKTLPTSLENGEGSSN